MGKRTKTKIYCIECGNEVSPHSRKTTKRCSDCRYKSCNIPTYKDGRCLQVTRCIDCGELLDDYRSERCFSCSQSYLKQGSKNPSWKNGLGTTPLVHNIRMCFNYRQWRSDIFTRDNFTCQCCGKRGGNLNAHHTPKSFATIIKEYNIKTSQDAINCEELWNINNGITLCTACHKKVHKVKSRKERR